MKILSVSNKSNKATNKLTLASIKKITPISTKSQKEVNQISKYFKNIKLAEISKQPQKTYAQTLNQGICKKMKQWTSIYFPFSFFIFISIILHFSIFRTLGLGLEVIDYTITSVTSDSMVTTLITELEKKE